MPTSRTHSKRFLQVGAFLLLGGAILLYGLLESRNLIQGPQITISSPQDGSTATSSLAVITGTAKNVAFITLNDRQIYLDENGRLEEKLLLSEGYNIITLKARDKFGKAVERQLELVLN